MDFDLSDEQAVIRDAGRAFADREVVARVKQNARDERFDREQPGFRTQAIHHKMGLHGSDTASIALDGVFVPGDALLGEVDQGFKVAMRALDAGRYSVAAGCVGICQGCVEESVRYATERRRFGRLYEGTSQIQRLIVGRALTDIDALVPA